MFYRTGIMANYYIAEIRTFDLFCSCDLDHDPITFVYELNAYPFEIGYTG